MMCLQRLDTEMAVFLDRPDALSGCFGGCHGGDIGNAVLDGSLADVAVIVHALLADRGVDDELDLSVGDEIADVRSALIHLEHTLAGDALCL